MATHVPSPPKAASKTGPARKHSLRRACAAIVILVICALTGARLYLPYWVKDYVNAQIAALDGYGGSVGDIDISLWRGAYEIHDLDIHKTKGGLKQPFVAVRTIDLSVQWAALLRGTIVAEVELNDIALTFAKSQSGKGASWVAFVDNLTPFDINRLAVNGGKVAYVDQSDPDVNLYLNNIQAEVTNLRNIEQKEELLPSALQVRGTSIGNGALTVNGRGNILKEPPDFDLDMKLENAALPAINKYSRKAAAIDFKSGNLSVYMELAALNGKATGYVKPIATKVDMINEAAENNPLNLLWQGLVAAFVTVFKNHPRDQFALRIPLEGSLENPDRDMWSGFWSIFKNAFGKAFPRNTEGNINLNHAIELYGVEK